MADPRASQLGASIMPDVGIVAAMTQLADDPAIVEIAEIAVGRA
ncbi:MAG: hypothetical protein R3F31_03685 [Verrucomicrobiales bacterium]